MDDTSGLLAQAAELYTDDAAQAELSQYERRLAEPLRVAIAGKVKAGKSTLLNALVGDLLAPTDEGECTRIVTWYQDGHTYEVILHGVDGSARQIGFHRDAGAIEIDLGDTSPDDVESLEITWPSSALKRATLIDTPGIGSLSANTSARTWSFVQSDDEETPADAVLYLMKHLHSSDLEFLEAFHDTEVSTPNPVNAIGVLSRADEIGVGRMDCMASARSIADRYRNDGRVRRLVQTVVPVAGLLAESAATLTQDEYKALALLAEVDVSEAEKMLLSTDRFINAEGVVRLTTLEREQLLRRFGVFGVRLATVMIRHGTVANARELAEELLDRSGLNALLELLTTLFVDRRDLLKSRSALFALDRLLTERPIDGSLDLRRRLEQILANAHEFNELHLLSAMRAGAVDAKPVVAEDIERLLGTQGTAPSQRLGVVADTGRDQLREIGLNTVATWQRRAENPMVNHDLQVASRVVIRTCEGIVAALG